MILLGAGEGLISSPEIAISAAAAIVEGRTRTARANWREQGKVEGKGDLWRMELGPGDDASPLWDIYAVEIKKADCQILTYEPIEGSISHSNRLGLLPASKHGSGGRERENIESQPKFNKLDAKRLPPLD
jgi:hypothetical protein